MSVPGAIVKPAGGATNVVPYPVESDPGKLEVLVAAPGMYTPPAGEAQRTETMVTFAS